MRYSVLSQAALELPSFPLPTTENMAEQASKKHPENPLGRECQSRCKESFRKIIGFLLDEKKRPKSDSFPPSILWSATTTKGAGERQAGWVQAVLAIRAWFSIPAVLWSPPVTLGKSLTSVVICFPCCKTQPIIQASLTVGPCGEDVELWNTWTAFEWRLHVNEQNLVSYLKWDSQMSTEYLWFLGGDGGLADCYKLYNFLLVHEDTLVK